MSKDQWIADHERALKNYANDGDRSDAMAELRNLGFSEEEASKQLDEIDREQATSVTLESLQEEKHRVDAEMHLRDLRQDWRKSKGGY